MREGEAIESRLLTRQIERAQRKVEAHNFDIRKNLLEYDDVANDQRKVVYQQRDDLMDADDISETIINLRYDMVNAVIDRHIPPQSLEEQWDVAGLTEALKEEFDLDAPIQAWLDADDDLHEEPLRERLLAEIIAIYDDKAQQAGAEQMRRIEKEVMLYTLDSHWKEHLAAMDYLRQGIHLRGYAQKNPKQEYKREAFERFSAMLDAIKLEVVQVLSRLQLQAPPALPSGVPDPNEFEFTHEAFEGLGQPATAEAEVPPGAPVEKKPFVRPDRKIGRNDPCPCGSGKKYKHCHGKLN
jgi:preprotein translocase subunit SecA